MLNSEGHGINRKPHAPKSYKADIKILVNRGVNHGLNSPIPGPVFPRSRKVFALGKPLQNLKSQSCLIHIFLIWTEAIFKQTVSEVYIHLSVFRYRLITIVLRTRNVSRAFENWAPGILSWLKTASPGMTWKSCGSHIKIARRGIQLPFMLILCID